MNDTRSESQNVVPRTEINIDLPTEWRRVALRVFGDVRICGFASEMDTQARWKTADIAWSYKQPSFRR